LGLDKSDIGQNFKSKFCSDYKLDMLIRPGPEPDARCSDPIVRMSEYVMWFLDIMTEPEPDF